MTEPALITDTLDIEPLAKGECHRFWVTLTEDAAGRPIRIPVMVARGHEDGPIIGVTAAIHGNELNGIPTIHRLFRDLEPAVLRGTLVAVPLVNLPGYLEQRRVFTDGYDLNRVMPGREDSSPSRIYAHRFMTRIVRSLQYLVDLHTASFGRVNSLYVRADMRHETTAAMARLISPQIIVHNEGTDGTLRSAAEDLGIHAITVEVGDPQRFQRGLIRSSRLGIQALLAHLGMLPEIPGDSQQGGDTVECSHSYWISSDCGGILQVFAEVAARVERGQRLATLTNLFGDVIREFLAPEDAIVVGATSNPVAQTGARIVHLGIEGNIR